MTPAIGIAIEAPSRIQRDLAHGTDRDLLAACLAHDERAWRELMRRYADGLRAVVYKRLRGCIARLPSTFRDDVMGAFWLKLLERDMKALRSFDWNAGSALFSWLALLVTQCAIDYLRLELDQPRFVPVEDAHCVADEGGVLTSGRKPLWGSLSARVRERNAKVALAEKSADRKARRKRRGQRRARARQRA